MLHRSSRPKGARVAPILLLIELLLIVACAGGSPQVTEEPEPREALAMGYQMAVVKTSTPTPDPAVTATREATAVPLATPSPAVAPTSAPLADVPRIEVAEAKAKVDAGEAIIADVRSLASYELGHIAASISMPSAELAKRYTELPTDKLIIFYCA